MTKEETLKCAICERVPEFAEGFVILSNHKHMCAGCLGEIMKIVGVKLE